MAAIRRRLGSRIPLIVYSVATLLAYACGPAHNEVKADFLAEHPGTTVVDVGVGEGDGSAAYMQIRFRRSGRDEVCSVEWGYQRADGQWRLFHKGKPTC